MNQNSTLKFGPIIHAADPAYDRKTKCAKFNIKIKPGAYNHEVLYSDEGPDWGTRVKSLAIYHSDYKVSDKGWKLDAKADIGVDSGQAGFFDDSIYPNGADMKENGFYASCSNVTLGDSYYEMMLCHDTKRDLELVESWKEMGSTMWEEKILKIKAKVYGENSQQYRYLKEKITKPTNPWLQYGVLENRKGIISRTGYGDGSYKLYYKKNAKKQIVALKIRFI